MNGTDEPRFRLGLARGALAWEQIWPAFWPAVGVAGLFIAIALFNVAAVARRLAARAGASPVRRSVRRRRLVRRTPHPPTRWHGGAPPAGARQRPDPPAAGRLARHHGGRLRSGQRRALAALPGAGASADAQPQGPAAPSQSGGARSLGLARGGRSSPVRRGVRHLGRLGAPARRRLHASPGRLRPMRRMPRWTSG